jgi:hypothetical protein
MADNRYIHIWTKSLKAFGWPPQRIESFISQWSADLADEESIFYHEDPAYYLTWEILPERAVDEIHARLAGKSAGRPWELFESVQSIINKHLRYYEKLFNHEPPEEPDWQAVKMEIMDFLGRHGETLRYG